MIRCPNCTQAAKVPAAALGLFVQCPACEATYEAVDAFAPLVPTVQPVRQSLASAPPPPTIPTVYPVRARRADEHSAEPSGLLPVLVALPIGIPLLWLILTQVARPSSFSFLAPLVIAFSIAGLSLGLASIKHWSTRIRCYALGTLSGLAYGTTTLFYFAPLDLLEVAREFAVFNSGLAWKDYPIPDTRLKVRVPNGESKPVEWLPKLPLQTREFLHRRKPVDRFLISTGELSEFPAWPKDITAWYESFQKELEEELGATVIRSTPVTVLGYVGHEYILEYPGEAQRQVIRTFRTKRHFIVLSVEGPFLFIERPDIQSFFRSLKAMN